MEVAVVIDPTQFGIEPKQAAGIEQAFAPAIEERKALTEIYGQLITEEMTPELCDRAKEFDKQLLQCEKNITATHKAQKDFSLQYGRLCDAWKNKEIEPVKQMRERVGEIKKHFELIEAARVASLHSERKTELDVYEFEGDLNLGELSETVYAGILQGAKLSKAKRDEDARIAEVERLEAARLEAIEAEAREKERIEAKAEVAILAEELAEREAAERKIAAERAKLDQEAKAREDAAKAEAKAAQDKLDAIEVERKAKLDAEVAELKAKEEAAKKAAAAPDKDKLVKWITELTLPTAPVQSALSGDITMKFAGFKKWALSEIEKSK